MPFTLAHPVAVLPFMKERYRLSATALIAGSVMPDFEFFLQLREVENIGHHWFGILLLDLPATIIFTIIFHVLIKPAFYPHLPLNLKERFVDFVEVDWFKSLREHPMTIMFSALIGIFTHLIIDGFTHHDGFALSLFPVLDGSFTIGEKTLPFYFLLQLLLSLLGSVYVIYFIRKLPRFKIVETDVNRAMFWITFSVIFVSVLAIRVGFWPEYNTFWGLVMAFLGSLTYATLGVAVVLRIFFSPQYPS
ncbi:DUF4184 family protein [Jiulongibacter sp. NS-SX5]|uniref:DUF4184 family protein n=1 Tax=Jiulongibacter sp. NS-SX5 TaxID=3463854 RepID=UPI004059FFC0